jgi:hypothetical protein
MSKKKLTLEEASDLATNSLLESEDRRGQEWKNLREEWEYATVDEEKIVAQEAPSDYNTIKLVNKIGARVKMVGAITVNQYEWPKSGAVVEVDERDVPDLLTKRLGDKLCCGSTNMNYVFEIMKD